MPQGARVVRAVASCRRPRSSPPSCRGRHRPDGVVTVGRVGSVAAAGHGAAQRRRLSAGDPRRPQPSRPSLAPVRSCSRADAAAVRGTPGTARRGSAGSAGRRRTAQPDDHRARQRAQRHVRALVRPERPARPGRLLRRAAYRPRSRHRSPPRGDRGQPPPESRRGDPLGARSRCPRPGSPAAPAAYGLPSATAGNGQTVYIVDAYDDPSAESDLAVYRSHVRPAACTSANRLLPQAQPERPDRAVAGARHRLGGRDLP